MNTIKIRTKKEATCGAKTIYLDNAKEIDTTLGKFWVGEPIDVHGEPINATIETTHMISSSAIAQVTQVEFDKTYCELVQVVHHGQ